MGDSFQFGNGLTTVVSDFITSFYPELQQVQSQPTTSKNKPVSEVKSISV